MGQIRAAVAEAAQEAGYEAALAVVVEVPDGEALAGETMNPRLGIVGGISILGVSGHRAAVQPCRLEGRPSPWPWTWPSPWDTPTSAWPRGGAAMALLAERFPELPPTALVEVADYFAFPWFRRPGGDLPGWVQAAFVGKLAKMAQGLANTHAHRAATDF